MLEGWTNIRRKYQEIGHAAGFTRQASPPATIALVYAERDTADAKLHSEALKRFTSGWRKPWWGPATH
jgi:hypothetical protein